MRRPTIFVWWRAKQFARLVDQPGTPPASDSLHARVALAHALSASSEELATAPAPEFRLELRAMLVAEAERQRVDTRAGTVAPPVADPTAPVSMKLAPPGGTRGRSPARATHRGHRTRAAVIVLLAAGTLAVSGISVASGSAMPGDALYGVKRSREDARVALAGSDRDRGSLYLQFARNRMGEARGVSGTAGLFGLLAAMDQDTIQATALLTGAALRQADPSLLDPLAQFVADQRRGLTDLALTSADVRRLTAESSDLLDKVADRIDAARTAIACHAPVLNDGQPLGPGTGRCP